MMEVPAGALGPEWPLVDCGNLLDEVCRTLEVLHGESRAVLVIERLVVGIHFVGVKLSDGSGGVAYLPPEMIHQGSNHILKGKRIPVRGQSAFWVAGGALDHPLAHVIRLATLNALSLPFMRGQRNLVDEAGDLSDYPALFEGRRVCIVGAILPLLKKIRHLPTQIEVIDRKVATQAEADAAGLLRRDEVEAAAALGRCETAIFTGASVANGSILDLIAMVSEEAAIAVVGPSAGFVPDPLFARGVAFVGTSIVTDIDDALEILSEGGGGYQLFGRCVQKINLMNHELLIKRLAQPPRVLGGGFP